MKKTVKDIGKYIWISGNGFVLYKTCNILNYISQNLYNIKLEKQKVVIISPKLFMLKNGDIFKL